MQIFLKSSVTDWSALFCASKPACSCIYRNGRCLADSGMTQPAPVFFYIFSAAVRLRYSWQNYKRPFSLEVFQHTGHRGHLLFTAELPICSRNAETPKTVSRCMVSGRFWAFSFDMSGFVLAAVSFTANHSKAAVCHFRVTKKRRIATTLLSCLEDGTRERYSIICCTFSFCLQPLYQWQHRR